MRNRRLALAAALLLAITSADGAALAVSGADFSSEEEAKNARNMAENRKNQTEEVLKEARNKAECTRQKKTEAETLIRRYEKELPARKKEKDRKKKI